MILTTEQIALIRSQATDACNDRNGDATCLHMRADIVLALAETAQENERLREAALEAILCCDDGDPVAERALGDLQRVLDGDA